jgi:hypothetical protein
MDDDAAVALLREEFASNSCVKLVNVLESSLVSLVQAKVREASFHERIHPASGRELCMEEDQTVGLLRFLFTTPVVFDLVDRITGCAPITSFICRIYIFRPNAGDVHHWHDDCSGGRQLGFSLNLSDRVFDGGELELRRRGEEEAFCQTVNTGLGDALIFRIDDELEHRVLPVTGSVPKVALAGWFIG